MNHDPPGGGSGGRQTASLDRMFDVLSHPYRRRLLTVLAEADPRADEELSPGELHAEGEDLKHVRIELFHHHLPKLAEAGYIHWDRETNTVRHGPTYDEIAPLVELLVAHEDELATGWP